MSRAKLAALLAALTLVFSVGAVAVTSAQTTTSPKLVTGTGSCTTDANGTCAITHALGVAPDTVVVSANAPAQANAYILSTVQGSFTDKVFKVRAMLNRTTPKANGTVWVAYIASVGMGTPPATTSAAPTTTPTTATTPGTTTPPAVTSTPSTPPTTTTTTATPPSTGCANPQTIAEQDGRTYAASGTTGQYYVHNDAWNWQGNDGKSTGQFETLYLCNYNNWWVDSWGFRSAEGEVFMYPSTKWDATTGGCCKGLPLSTWPSQFAGRFAGTTNAVWNTGSYDVAWDLWLNGVADQNSLELMVWTQKAGHADPAGTSRGTYVAGDGKVYDVWWDGAQRGGYLAFISQTTQTSGTVDLRAMITYASSKGYLPAGTPTVNQVNYGVEVRDTGSATQSSPARFTLTDFALTMK